LEKVCATLGALTKVGGNTVGDSVVWSEAGQELVLSKNWEYEAFGEVIVRERGQSIFYGRALVLNLPTT
jgi:hypothetical protein